jgi:pyruvate,water dikinase
VEFTVDERGDISVVQTRPITTLKGGRDANENLASPSEEHPSTPSPDKVLLRGVAASPGIASGKARVLTNPSEGSKLREGEILVTPMTAPDWVPIMRRAAAIVTDAGGMTSHASIVSRELGIPCVVGAREATRTLHDGQIITVNGTDGSVREGEAPGAHQPRGGKTADSARLQAVPIVTGTRLYVNLAEPELAEEIAARDVDGVGLLRAEFMLLSALDHTHPKQFLEQRGGEEFVARMSEKLLVFARAFHPRPILYRATDFRSNEFRGLAGGDRFEPQEANPMIGYRGCFRYTREPELFALELRALHAVRAERDNLHLMIPFVRTRHELAECLRLVDTSPLGADRRLERWIMAEVPSIGYWLAEYAALGITGVSIGSNDLTQLVLGVDRDSEVLAPLYDERDPAVLHAVRAIIVGCQGLRLKSSICGQAPSIHPEYAELLVRWGVDSISVNPDALEATRRSIAAAEQRLTLEHARTGHEGSPRMDGGSARG